MRTAQSYAQSGGRRDVGLASMGARRYRPSRARAFALAAVAAGAGAASRSNAGICTGWPHDQDFLRLSAPLGGRAQAVASADGTRLHVEAFGPETGPTIVLAHGWTEQLSFWGPVISALTARGIRSVAYDLRGHGRSAPGAGHDYSLRRFGEDLEAVVAAVMPDGQRATVAGHSLGAMSIAAWAEHHDVGARVCAAAHDQHRSGRPDRRFTRCWESWPSDWPIPS